MSGRSPKYAEPNMRRPEGDGLLVVRAHPHGQGRNPGLPGHLVQQREVHRGLLVHRGDAHEAGDSQLQILAAVTDEFRRLRRNDPGLLVLLSGVDLDQAFDIALLLLAFLGDDPGEFLAVDAFDCVEEPDRVGGFVGLERADHPKVQAGIGLAALRPSGHGLLDPVLPENPLARRQRRVDALVGLLLGDRHQRDPADIPVRPARGPQNCPYFLFPGGVYCA